LSLICHLFYPGLSTAAKNAAFGATSF